MARGRRVDAGRGTSSVPQEATHPLPHGSRVAHFGVRDFNSDPSCFVSEQTRDLKYS